MVDKGLLKEIGLTDKQLEALLSKVDNFVKTLDPIEQTALRKKQAGGEAGALLQENVKSGQLESFIKARTGSGVIVTFERTMKGPNVP